MWEESGVVRTINMTTKKRPETKVRDWGPYGLDENLSNSHTCNLVGEKEQNN